MQFLCNFNCKLSAADKCCTALQVNADPAAVRLLQTDESNVARRRRGFLGSLEFSDERTDSAFCSAIIIENN